MAAKLSGRHDVASLFDDVIDETFKLFGVERAGLWRYDTASTRPLTLAAQRGLSSGKELAGVTGQWHPVRLGQPVRPSIRPG
ncbi:MAG: GAF domain-containing protein [Candidatus Limnocylindrales bacterium]